MKNTKIIGFILLILGIILLGISGLADIIGLGETATFGYKQIAGSLIGALMTIVGLVLACKK